MIGGKTAFTLTQDISKLRAVCFYVEDVNDFISPQSKFVPGNFHHKAIPFQIVPVPENGVVRVTSPQIFDIASVSALDVAEDLFSQ